MAEFHHDPNRNFLIADEHLFSLPPIRFWLRAAWPSFAATFDCSVCLALQVSEHHTLSRYLEGVYISLGIGSPHHLQ